jgi:hypothetical protein
MKWVLEQIWWELVPSQFKGASEEKKRNQMFWYEIFTHFLEELNLRAMDFNVFTGTIRKVNRKIGQYYEERMAKILGNDSLN